MLKHAALAVFAAPILAFAAAPALAQEAPVLNTERMTAAVEAEASAGKFMGAVLVADGDELVLERAWG